MISATTVERPPLVSRSLFVLLFWLLAFSISCQPLSPAAETATPLVASYPAATFATPLFSAGVPTPLITPTRAAATPAAPILPGNTATAPVIQPPPVTATAPAIITPSLTLTQTQYTLWATLAEDWQQLVVSQTISYVNLSSEPLRELVLVVEPNRFPGAFALQAIHWADGRPVSGYELAGARLRLPLGTSLAPGAAVHLFLTYTLTIPEVEGPFGRTARQVNLGDWYPFVPPYRPGEGWLVREPAEVGEHLVYDVADYRVAIRLPAGSGLRLIASAPAEVDGEWRHFSLDNGRSFAWSVSPEYRFLTRQAGRVVITAAVFPQHLAAGHVALRTTAEAVALYSRLFGPYPHATLAVVEADFGDGMEYEGLYFIGEGFFSGEPPEMQGYLIPIAAHETAHQWWYGRVGNDQAMEPWLDESLCTYSELLFFESEYPELVQWWWDFRINRFLPAGWVDSTVYEQESFRPYVDAVYLRGAQWLDEVRRLLGDELFLAFLEAYSRQYNGRQATGEAFWGLLAVYDPGGMGELREAYFRP